MNDLEGYSLYYVINKHQRGFSKIVGACVVDQCDLLNKKGEVFADNTQVDACFFQMLEDAETFKTWLEKRGILHLEVRRYDAPYTEIEAAPESNHADPIHTPKETSNRHLATPYVVELDIDFKGQARTLPPITGI